MFRMVLSIILQKLSAFWEIYICYCCCCYTVNHALFAGKHCASSKAKKFKGKAADPGEGTSSYKIPRKTSQPAEESDDDIVGQEIVKPASVSTKFCDTACYQIRSMIKTDQLLPREMSALRPDLEKLILYLASKATWSKHCSAWNLYNEFCWSFSVKFELPIPMSYARAFTTWAITKRKLKDCTVTYLALTLLTLLAIPVIVI